MEREDIDSDLLSNLASTLADSVHDSKGQDEVVEGGFTLLSQNGHRLLLHRGSTSHLGAIVEGREDEAFLADMMSLADKAESIFSGEDARYEGEEPHESIQAHMRQLLDSEIYEGIDYAKEDPKLRQNKLFEHITLGILRKAGIHPVCVAIDDLQWADPSSLALLHYAARNTRKTRVLFLGTYRREEAAARHQLRDTLKGMEQEEILAEMDLNGLTREDLPDLAESFIGSHILSDALLDHLWRETRGFPLFVREVLLGLEDDGEIVTRGVVKLLVCPLDKVALPERVRDVIRARLDRLPIEDRRLLDAAATCGTRFTAALVSRVAGEEERMVLNGLSAIARVHGLLRPADSGFTFDHPAVQEVLYDGVPIETRQTYHKEAAEWLELAGAPIADIAEHYYLAHDPRAVVKLRKAAEDASQRYSNEEGIRFYLEALEFELDSEERCDILENLGSLYDRIGNSENALTSYQHVWRLVEGDEKQAGIKARIAEIHGKRGEHGKALRACTDGMRLVQGHGSKAEASILSVRAQLHVLRGDPSLALEDHTKALKIREAIGDERGIAQSLGGLARTLYELRDYARVLESGEKMLSKSMEIDYPDGVMSSLNFLGVARYHLGENESALDFWKRSLHGAEKIGRVDAIPGILNNIGNIHSERGEYDLALDYYSRALIGFKRSGHKEATVIGLLGLSDVYLETNDVDMALQVCREAESMAVQTGLLALEAKALRRFAQCYIKNGELEEALQHCGHAFSIASELGDRQVIAASKSTYGVIFREQGDWDKSVNSFQECLEINEELGAQAAVAAGHLNLGVTWKQQGNTTKARTHLLKSIDLWERLGNMRFLAEARRSLDELTDPTTSENRESRCDGTE
ncbi:MAG: tetratricopeptide repeat protein [Candidatus Thermoplasmatota archaeon]|nr:tetratricopeptide repeat protein [Candidatus Thermoplasmatota archaeon]